jgi:hypothetical protein
MILMRMKLGNKYQRKKLKNRKNYINMNSYQMIKFRKGKVILNLLIKILL